MGLKKTDAMQRFCLIRHSLVLMTSHRDEAVKCVRRDTGPNASSII